MPMLDHGQAGKPPLGRLTSLSEDINRNHNEIVGLERRLAAAKDDVTVARLVLGRRYAAFAADMVRQMGGDVKLMKALTDRNNIIPLAGSGAGE